MPTLRVLSHLYITQRTDQGLFTGATPKTVRTTLTRFCELVGAEREPSSLTRRDMERWLERPDLAASTRRNQFGVVRAWIRWLVERGHLRRDPTIGVRTPRQPDRVPRRVHADAVTLLLAAAPDERAQVVLLLMYEEGMRCCEVARAQIGDVDLFEAVMLVRGKGNKQREVALGEATAAAIRRYLSAHPAPAGPLIRSYAQLGHALSAGYVSSRVCKWMTDAGLRPEKIGNSRGQHPSGHWLRHTAAKESVEVGADLRDVQSFLGHSSLQTTSVYVGLTPVSKLRQVMERRSVARRPGVAVGDRPGRYAADQFDLAGDGAKPLRLEPEPRSHFLHDNSMAGEAPGSGFEGVRGDVVPAVAFD